ncbi:MAG TPA: hypothetical protein VLA98_04260, partial [Solirubrobacteraceae bacterium]|nr:hypothetical protein [Solirubrobacteraceae bacterium]
HEHPDLFWGLRGGGGNFGIVTELEFELHEVGPTILGGSLLFEWERAEEVLRAYRDITDAASEDLAGCAVLHQAPPAPFVPADLVGEPVLELVVAAFSPDMAAAEELVAPLRALHPLLDVAGAMPYTELQKLTDPGAPHGMQGCFERPSPGAPRTPTTSRARARTASGGSTAPPPTSASSPSRTAGTRATSSAATRTSSRARR